MKTRKISLNGSWELYYAPNEAAAGMKPLSTAEAVRAAGFESVAAEVPGNFELDLHRAGIIPDPYFGTNIWETEKYEYYHLWYVKTFSCEDFDGTAPVFVFEGIDTFAEIWLNGKKIGETDNMLVPFEIEPTSLRAGENELVIHITPAMIAARRYPAAVNTRAMKYNAGSLYVRKAPSQYGWDIMPRAVSAGIWRPAALELRPLDRIDDVFIALDSYNVEKAEANISVDCNLSISRDDLSRYRLTIKGVCGDSVFHGDSGRLWHTSTRVYAHIGSARFWWPRNYGEASLYDVDVTLWRDGEAVFTKSLRYGVRHVELIRTSTTDRIGSGEFLIKINGQRIFVLGTNWVQVDAYHSLHRERLPKILPMLCDLGCNAVRMWGGNVYEDDYFYDWCDENGILIWQDFAMACAMYPQDKIFCRLLSLEAEKVIKRLRNHACICIWAGDNECDQSYFWGSRLYRLDPNDNVLTRKVIPDQLKIHDYTRPYLPSSPYVDEEAFRTGAPIPEDHLWGPRDYFKGEFYGTAVAHFASETGYHGCPSPESLKKFISPEQLWHWTEDRSDPNSPIRPDWLCHSAMMENDCGGPYAYRNRLMSNQVKTLFGVEPTTLEMYARASQISQAEAKKFFIERFRVTKWRRTGIIWWNLIDGWPQISDAVVDWYGSKKLAYHYIRRSQNPFQLIFAEPELDGTRLPLFAVNDSRKTVSFGYEVLDLTGSGGVVMSGEGSVEPDGIVRLNGYRIARGEKRFYLIKWKTADGACGVNHYMSNIRDIDLDEYLGYMKVCGFDAEFEGFGG